ncbi:unnamed protein product [Closterium sp. Yama58-4]|nr:unnamed protein product [Closterium sp. Yama58-4]
MADRSGDRPAQGTTRGDNGAGPAGGDKGLIPRSNKEYLNIEYWDKRFEVEESFEWCGDYSQFNHLLLAHIRPCDRVLILGNGTSDLPECLWRDGRRHITATDLSALVVHRMALRSTALGSAAVCAAAPAAVPATAANTAPDGAVACDTHFEAAAHTATGEASEGTQPSQHQHQQQQPSSSPATHVGAITVGREGQAQNPCTGLTGSTAADSSSGGGPCSSTNSSSSSSSGGGGYGSSSSNVGGVVCGCGRAAGITWAVADMMALPFPDAAFDVVLEKGVLDVLLVDSESPWHVPPPIVHRVHTALSQAHRVLTPHGRLLSITFGQPHFRRPLYEAPHLTWTLQGCYRNESCAPSLTTPPFSPPEPLSSFDSTDTVFPDHSLPSRAMAARPLAALRLSYPFTPIRIPSPIPLIRRSASACALLRAAPRCYHSRSIRGSPTCAHLPSSAAYPLSSSLSRPIPPAQRASLTGEAARGGYLTRAAIAHGCPADRRLRSGVTRAASAMAEAGGLMAGGGGEQSIGARNGSSAWGGGASRVQVRRLGENPTEIIDLPAETRFRASPAADGAAAAAADGIAVEIRSSIVGASSAGVPPPAVLVVPGNPGVCAYYTDFALALHSALGGAARVVVVGHVAHTEREMEGGRLYSLQHQIQHKIRFIQEEAGIVASGNEADETAYQQQQQQQSPQQQQQQQQQQRWVVVGHSIGAHIAVEMRRHLPSHVVHVVGLFPFLAFNHQSDEQRRLKLIASLTPLLAVVAALLQVVRVLPAGVLRWVVRRGVGKAWSHGAVHVTATAMLRYNMLRNYAYMGHTEFIYFSQREFDWAFLSSNAPHFTFIFGRDDHWGPLHLHQQMQERVPEVAAYVDEEGHEHTFCCTDRGASSIATYVAKLLRSHGAIPAT